MASVVRLVLALAVGLSVRLVVFGQSLNPGPAFLLRLGLSPGFESRLLSKSYGPALTIRLPARQDHIALKLWSATSHSRGNGTRIDVHDLSQLQPTRAELIDAARWCNAKDGSFGFVATTVLPVFAALGHKHIEAADV